MAIGESSTSPPPSPARRHEVEEVSMDEDGDELEEELEDRPIIHSPSIFVQLVLSSDSGNAADNQSRSGKRANRQSHHTAFEQ